MAPEQSDAASPRDENAPRSPRSPISPRRRGTAGDGDFISPTRRATGLDDPGSGIRRRSSVASRRSGSGVPSLAPRTTLAERTQGRFTMAGPEETPQLRLAHEPFVQPGYGDLNPSYEQPANAKPVWGLAKPLPRVVRPGMVPTKEELLEARANVQLPAENSQKLGLDVDPNDLEQGQIEKTADPRKMAAQNLSTVPEGETPSPSETHEGPPHLSDEPLEPVPEEPELRADDGKDVLDDLPNLEEIEAAYPDDLHPLVQELVEDEVHNNHTTWSVIRTHHREALAESLGVFVQLFVGFSADLAVTVADAGNPNTTAWAWGLATMMGIYVSGGVSGAHFNPAITIMLWFYRGFPKRKMPEYFAAQFLGAFIAALAAYGLYYESIRHYQLTHDATDIINSFVTNQREAWIGPGTAFFTEFLGTMILSTVVLALGDDQNAPPGAGMNSLIVGLMVACLTMTFAYQTGAALNPSRDFGPRLALLAVGYPSSLFTNPYWFYGPWVGAVTGSFMGAFLYDFFIFTGGESPVNYPWERTQRAMRKSRMKWKKRLRLSRLSRRERGEKTVR
ncbi:hypothetical protein ASPCADRAFT_207005 [Aspergillus carbonarius ITEM 5010]|uniref:MIP transporter n=1 Tax=Aspergillus carbonarius (strain ITEM 5010) TaxID=602072 RepID=A0A1R3RQY3_ASPC5|nr:hypothetical protein ASPCADRAFT_207005 [Aspergillus carbonarius ITEM 5010]